MRRREVRSTLDLAEYTPHQPAYLKQQNIAIDSFSAWLEDEEFVAPLVVLVNAPTLLALLLRAYGAWMFRANKPLYMFLCTLTAIQKVAPLVRPHLFVAWQLAADWRSIEPTIHRVPVPLALYKALIVLCWLAGWFRMAGCILIAFSGPGRIGEILKAARCKLVLPVDSLGDHADRFFLRITEPKSGKRGGATVQHISVRGPTAVAMASLAFGELSDDEKLFPGSESLFRSRWNQLMVALGVPKSARFTPGGLRGGGAVCAYFDDVPVADIMWRMRIKEQSTLAHYLQEVTATNSLRDLPQKARSNILRTAGLFDVVCLQACRLVSDNANGRGANTSNKP